MQNTVNKNPHLLARTAGWSLLATIVVGILASIFVSKGIDINLSADVATTANNMLEAESRLMAKAYLAILTFCLGAVFYVALYLLLREFGPLLAAWCLFVSLAASVLSLLGAVFAMNAAQIAGNIAYTELANGAQRELFAGLQATSDYTSFHLSLVISSLGNAGFFYLLYRSKLIPKIISGWGVFASLFVAITIVARDFIPVLGHTIITASFMLSNLVALLSTGLYLTIRGVRHG